MLSELIPAIEKLKLQVYELTGKPATTIELSPALIPTMLADEEVLKHFLRGTFNAPDSIAGLKIVIDYTLGSGFKIY